MSRRKSVTSSGDAETPQGEQRILPPLPPRPAPKPTAEDLALQKQIMQNIKELHAAFTEKNLLRVKRLVEMALRGQAPEELVHHFSLIGRDYYKLADYGPQKPNLRAIEGGPK
jgi:hypothetical protein